MHRSTGGVASLVLVEHMQDPGVCHSVRENFFKSVAWTTGTFVGHGKLKLATRLHHA